MKKYDTLSSLGEYVLYIENKTILYENGKFYGITQDNKKVEIDKDKIKEYAATIIELVKKNGNSVPNTLNLACILDQPIFDKENWHGKDRVDMVRVEMVVNKCKKEIKEYTPEKTKEMIKYAMHESEILSLYIMQLLSEGIIEEQALIDNNFLNTFNKNLITELCSRKLIPITLLTQSKSIKGLDAGQINRLTKEGFFKDMDEETMQELCENGFLTPDGLLELEDLNVIEHSQTINLLGGLDNVCKLYRRAKNRNESQLYWDILSPEDICNLYAKGKMTFEELEKLCSDIVDYEEEEDIYSVKKEIGKYILAIYYTDGMPGKKLIELSKNDYIPPEILINLVNTEQESDRFNRLKPEELLRYYTPDLVSKLLADKKVDSFFISGVNSILLSTLDEEKKEKYIKTLIRSFKEKSKDDPDYYQQIVNELINEVNLPAEYFRDIGLNQDVIDKFIEGKIKEEELIEAFNEGILSINELESIYDDNYTTIISLLGEGRLYRKVLSDIPAKALCDGLVDGKIGIRDVYEAYEIYDGISAFELGEIYGEYEEDYYLRLEEGEDLPPKVRIVDLITRDTGIDKIRELYLHDVLSHSDIKNLQEKEIITEEESNIISQIDRERLYQQIFSGTIISEYDDSDYTPRKPIIRTPGSGHTHRPSENTARKNFFKQIGKCDFRAVEAKDENAAFKNYTLIGYPDYGLVVLENYENDNNATYIMTLEEFKSFVNVNENGTVTFKKSKSAVKEERDRDQGKTIQTPNHVKTWGKNVITAMKALSKDAEREISIEQHIKLSRDMMDDYCENRILTGKLTDEEKKRKLKENELDKAKTENDLLNYYKKRMRRKFREINERLKKEEGQDYGE